MLLSASVTSKIQLTKTRKSDRERFDPRTLPIWTIFCRCFLHRLRPQDLRWFYPIPVRLWVLRFPARLWFCPILIPKADLSPTCSPSSSWRRGRSSTVAAILPSMWIFGLSNGAKVSAAVPSGASTDIYEALGLRDGGSDYPGCSQGLRHQCLVCNLTCNKLYQLLRFRNWEHWIFLNILMSPFCMIRQPRNVSNGPASLFRG